MQLPATGGHSRKRRKAERAHAIGREPCSIAAVGRLNRDTEARTGIECRRLRKFFEREHRRHRRLRRHEVQKAAGAEQQQHHRGRRRLPLQSQIPGVNVGHRVAVVHLPHSRLVYELTELLLVQQDDSVLRLGLEDGVRRRVVVPHGVLLANRPRTIPLACRLVRGDTGDRRR